MKKKSKNLVAGLILAASLLFSSCGGGVSGGGGGGNNPTPVEPDVPTPVIPDPDKPEDVPEPEDIPEELPSEDTPTDIDEEGLSDEAKAALDEFITKWGGRVLESAYEELEASAKKYGVSNNVIILLFKIMNEARSTRGYDAHFVVGFLDEELQLLKEIRFVNLIKFLGEISDKFFTVYEKEYLGSYDIGGVKYSDLERLEKIASTVNDSNFTSLVNTYKNEFDNLVVSEEYKDYQNRSISFGVIASEETLEIAEMIDGKTQLGFVRMLEQLRGAIGEERLVEMVDAIYGSINTSNPIETLIVGSQMFYSLKRTALKSFNPLELLKLEDFKNIVYVLLQDRKNAELIVSTVKDAVFPILKKTLNQNEEQRADLLKFEESLKVLTADHVIAVGNLLNNLLGLFTEEDYKNILENYSDISYLLSLLISKKQGIADVIKAIGATERGLLADVGNLFGIDVLKILDTVAENIVNITSMTDPTSAQAISNIMQVVADVPEKYEEKIGQAFDTLDGGSGSGSQPYVHVNGYLYSSYLPAGITGDELKSKLLSGEIEGYGYIYDTSNEINESFSFKSLPENINFNVSVDARYAGLTMMTFEYTVEGINTKYTASSPVAIKKIITGDAIGTNLSYYYSSGFISTYDLTEAIYPAGEVNLSLDMGAYFGAESRYVSVSGEAHKGWNLFKARYTTKEELVREVYVPCFAYDIDNPDEALSFQMEKWAFGVVGKQFKQYITARRSDVDYGVYQLSFFNSGMNYFNEEALPEFVASVAGTGTFTYNGEVYHYIAIAEEELKLSYIALNMDLSNAEFDEDGIFEAETFTCRASYTYYATVEFNVLGSSWNTSISMNDTETVTVSNLRVSKYVDEESSYEYYISAEFDYDGYHYETLK